MSDEKDAISVENVLEEITFVSCVNNLFKSELCCLEAIEAFYFFDYCCMRKIYCSFWLIEYSKEGSKNREYQEPSIQIEKPSVKLDPDTKVIEQYREAVTAGNDTKVKLIENIYNNEKLKDAIKE